MNKDIERYYEQNGWENILIRLHYKDDNNGERHYEILGLRSELESHIIGIIAKHDREGIKINKTYLDMLEEVK
jgi:hypothetical protein